MDYFMDIFELLSTFVLATSHYLTYIVNITVVVDAMFRFARWNESRKSKAISHDIDMQKNLQNVLDEYVLEKHNNNVKDIAIRCICSNNYPYNLDHDGYKWHLQILYYDTDKSDIFLGSWRDNTGIKICEHVWFAGQSVYVNCSNGVSFVDKANGSYSNFKEYKQPRLVYRLPYRNIVNYDFSYLLEREARFYTCHRDAKNFDPEVEIVPNIKDSDYTTMSIDNRLIMMGYNPIVYVYYILKSKILKIL